MLEPGSFILPQGSAPKIRALFDYWQSIHPESGLPGRQHLDPLDIPSLLPSIWMIDVTRAPLRFRFRLVGTEIVKFVGRDVTGLWLDEFFDGYETKEAFHIHRSCALTGVPGYRKGGVIFNPGQDELQAERLYLPLAQDGKEVDILLVMTLYVGEPSRRL